jgi:hypothetical protein
VNLVVGILLGAAIVYGVIAFAFRNPTRPRPRRSEIDHGGWNDTNGNSSFTHFTQ